MDQRIKNYREQHQFRGRLDYYDEECQACAMSHQGLYHPMHEDEEMEYDEEEALEEEDCDGDCEYCRQYCVGNNEDVKTPPACEEEDKMSNVASSKVVIQAKARPGRPPITKRESRR